MKNLLAIQIWPFRLSMRIKELVSCSKSVLSRSVRCLLSKTRHIFCPVRELKLRILDLLSSEKKRKNSCLSTCHKPSMQYWDNLICLKCFVCYCVRANQEKIYGENLSRNFIDLLHALINPSVAFHTSFCR